MHACMDGIETRRSGQIVVSRDTPPGSARFRENKQHDLWVGKEAFCLLGGFGFLGCIACFGFLEMLSAWIPIRHKLLHPNCKHPLKKR